MPTDPFAFRRPAPAAWFALTPFIHPVPRADRGHLHRDGLLLQGVDRRRTEPGSDREGPVVSCHATFRPTT
jgi:hypothetical protein